MVHLMYVILFRDIQKATQNFTTLLGQGSFGPVYKAKMAAGEVVAVKVLASNSKQGEKEFQTEVNATSSKSCEKPSSFMPIELVQKYSRML